MIFQENDSLRSLKRSCNSNRADLSISITSSKFFGMLVCLKDGIFLNSINFRDLFYFCFKNLFSFSKIFFDGLSARNNSLEVFFLRITLVFQQPLVFSIFETE